MTVVPFPPCVPSTILLAGGSIERRKRVGGGHCFVHRSEGCLKLTLTYCLSPRS